MMLARSHPRRLQRRALYWVLSGTTALGLVAAMPQPAYSFSWLEILRRGAQVYQLSTISDEREVKLGNRIHQQLTQKRIELYRDPALNQYVKRIGQRLVERSTRSDIPYKFHIVRDDSINAFAVPGGHIYVNTGLLQLADNEAELAGVLGHEIAHVAARHAIEQMRQQAIAQGVLSAAGLDESQAVQIGVELALNRPNSREDELEADRLGLQMMAKSRYAPIATVTFLQKLQQQQQSGSPPTFLSTHPGIDQRITQLRQELPEDSRSGTGLDEDTYQWRTRKLR